MSQVVAAVTVKYWWLIKMGCFLKNCVNDANLYYRSCQLLDSFDIFKGFNII